MSFTLLQVSLKCRRDLLFQCQKAVKTAKSRYFSEIVKKNCHRPKTLFTIINTISPSVCLFPNVSSSMCEAFLHFYFSIRLAITPSSSESSSPPDFTAVLVNLNPVLAPIFKK